MTGLKALFESRRFVTALADVIFSTVLYFVGKYAVPSAVEDVKFVILALQPVIGLLIAAFTVTDVSDAKYTPPAA